MFTCWRVSDCSLAWLTTSLKCTKVSVVKQFFNGSIVVKYMALYEISKVEQICDGNFPNAD